MHKNPCRCHLDPLGSSSWYILTGLFLEARPIANSIVMAGSPSTIRKNR